MTALFYKYELIYNSKLSRTTGNLPWGGEVKRIYYNSQVGEVGLSSGDILRTTLLYIYSSHDFYLGSIIFLHSSASAAFDVVNNEKEEF